MSGIWEERGNVPSNARSSDGALPRWYLSFFCFSHQAHISYHTSQAGLSCILRSWYFIVQNPCSWVHVFCGSTSGNYTSLSFPVIGNSHQGNLQPPISRSGNWLLNVVEENPDVANGLRTSSNSAAVLVRVAGTQQGTVSFISLNVFTIYENVTTTYHFHLFRIHYVTGVTLSGHLILVFCC